MPAPSHWVPPAAAADRGWPAKALPCNLTIRLTGGLKACYAATRASRTAPRVAKSETTADGRLALSHAMPLLNGRYRFLHVLAESEMGQIFSALDTYRPAAPLDAHDGRKHPTVAVKALNAKHWSLGAQEWERMRRLWKALGKRGATGAPILQPLTHFEEGAHFCLVFPLLSPLASLSLASPLSSLAAAAPFIAIAAPPPTPAPPRQSLRLRRLAHRIPNPGQERERCRRERECELTTSSSSPRGGDTPSRDRPAPRCRRVSPQ